MGLIVCAIVAARISGVSRGLDATRLEASMREAGPFGAVLFVGVFTVGVLAYLPGALFVAAGTLAYGKFWGFLLNLLAGIVASCAGFSLARTVGGQQLVTIKNARMRRLLDRIERRPVVSLVLLRAVMFISPPLNTTLALTRLRFREFALGTALGLIFPMAVTTFALDWLVRLPAFARVMRSVLG